MAQRRVNPRTLADEHVKTVIAVLFESIISPSTSLTTIGARTGEDRKSARQ
jgi:hypothetical protein